MPQIDHTEKHFTASETIRDVVIGMSDGLTVPFALAAGLSGAVASTHVIITAGLAEIIAGSIAMGLGGYLAARTDQEHYISERKREMRELREVPQDEEQEVSQILQTYGLNKDQATTIVNCLREDPNKWVDFMMRFELGLEPPDPSRALISALTIAGSYITGGLIPLAPYVMFNDSILALKISAILTLFALFGFGYVKGSFTGARPITSALQTSLIGGLAATAAFFLAKAFQ